MESLFISTRKHFLTIFPINDHFQVEIREIGLKHIWTSKILNFSSKDFNFCKTLHFYCSRFFLIDCQKQTISFVRGLQGGGCFGSKPKVIDVNVVSNNVKNPEKAMEAKLLPEKNFKPETESNLNHITKDLNEEISKVYSEEDEELKKICLEISNGIDSGFLDFVLASKVKSWNLIECKNISQILEILVRSIKFDVFKRFWFNKKVVKFFACFLKEVLIADILQDESQFVQRVEIYLPEIEKIVNWLESFNEYSNCIGCLIDFIEIYEIIKNYLPAKGFFKGLKHEINHSNILETLNKIQENSFTTPIKFYLILKSIQKTNQSPKQMELFFKTFFDSCLSYSKTKLFDFLSLVKSLLTSGHLSPEFLQTHYLKYSTLAQSQDANIRMISINFLKFLSSYPNPILSSSSKGLLDTLVDQEQVYSIKSQILPKTVKNPNKNVQSNIDLNHSELLFTRREELELMKKIIENKDFVEISGKPGSGKTSLALQYAKINKYSYNIIWKVNCEQPEVDLINLTQILGSGKDFKALSKILNESKIKILIIFDDASNLNKVAEFMIKNEFVSFIVITVNQVWKNCVNLNEGFEDFYKIYLDFGKFIGIEKSELEELKSNLIGLRVGSGIKANDLIDNRKIDKSDLKNMIKDYFEKADQEIRYCLGIISYFEYFSIPEKTIYEIFCKNFSSKNWKKTKSEIFQIGFIVYTEKQGELWSINEFIHNLCGEFLKSSHIESELTDYFLSNFTNDSNQGTDYSLQNINQLIFHPLAFHVLNFFYSSELTEKSLQIGISLLQNLSLINYDSTLILEIIEIIEEKIKEISSSNKTSVTINKLKALSKFAIQISKPEYGFSLFFDYLKLSTDLINKNTEEYLKSIIEFSELPQILEEEQEAVQEIFSSVRSNPSFNSSPLLVEILAKYSDSLILSRKYEEAETFIETSLKFISNSGSQTFSNKSESTLYLNLGYLLFLREEFLSSESNLQMSKKILEKSNQAQSKIYLSCLLFLSETYIHTSKESSRYEILSKAYYLAKGLYVQTHPDLIFITSQLLLECSANEKENYISCFLMFKSQFSDTDDLHLLDFRQSYDSLIFYKRHIYLIDKGIETFSKILDHNFPSKSDI